MRTCARIARPALLRAEEPRPTKSASPLHPPTAHPLPLENVLRDDEVQPSLDREEVLAMAPAAEDDRFRVPRILGEAP